MFGYSKCSVLLCRSICKIFACRMLNNAECAVVYVDADIDADNDWLINYMKFQFVSRLHPQLSRRTKLKMASQSAQSSAAMEVASGEEVISMK